MATTAFCNSAKVELLEGTHCLFATLSGLAGAGVSGQFTLTSLATTAGIAVGMAASGTGVAAGAIVASIDSATQVTVSKAHTGTVTTGTIAFTGDVLKMLLIKVTPTTTFAGTQTNVGTPGTAASSVTNVGTDEVAAGGGYTSGGTALTNVTPTLSTTTAITNFSPNPNWTSASFSATAAIIYNTTVRQGHANGITPNASGSAINRSISVHDFGGTQTVTSGTFTVVMPTADASNAILRIA
jgi:hypothetical protein